MLNLRGVFTVVLAFLVTSKDGSPLQSKDIEDFFNFLKAQQNDNVNKLPAESSSDSNSDEDSDNNSMYELLKNMEVIDLIEKAKQEKTTPESQKRNKNRHEKLINNPVYRNYEVNRHRDDTQQIIEQLLQDKDTEHYKKQSHQRITPSNLLNPISLEDENRVGVKEDDDSLNEYSKIFVVLDPLAIKKTKNKAALTNLLSRILSLSSASSEKARQERNKSNRYKGFKVKNNLFSRRYRRDSKESYGGRDSMEEDFKPKRSRNDHGGGGGGRARTAIPYIRQRGDIYERDH